ncbi:MAG TPA: hypothetical protein VIO38_01250 [Rariglobus sp.]
MFLSLAIGVSDSRALEFRLVSWDGDINDLNYATGGKVVPVAACESLLSPAYQWIGTGPLILFREVKQDGKTVRIPVATLTPPTELTHAILLLSATDASHSTYAGRWINDSLDARPLQTITYLNLSQYLIGIRLGEEEYTVAPQSSRTQATDTSVQRLLLKAAAKTPSGWEIIASTSQTVRAGRRTLVLLRDGRPQVNGHIDRIDFLIFNDRPQPPASPGTPVASR